MEFCDLSINNPKLMISYLTFNVKIYILSQVSYKKKSSD